MDLLDPLEAAMMTADVLSSPLNIGAVLILSPPPDSGPDYVDDLFARHLAGETPLDPRLCRFPHRGLDTGGMWVWREADEVELSLHLHRATLPGHAAGHDALWRLVSDLHAQPLDPSRPMWSACLIDGLADGCFALYIKVHHIVMDGVAGVQMITDALSPDPLRRGMPPFYADRRPDVQPHPAAGPRLPNPVRVLRSVAGAAASGAALTERVVVGEMSNVLASLTGDTTVPPLAAPHTRFNGRLGHERAVSGGSWPKERIRAVQQATGVTGNDVVTAVIAGVLRRWLTGRAELPEHSLVAICPITVRDHAPADEERHGNKFGLWLCPLGTDLDDPVDRLDLIHRSMSQGKQRVARRGSQASLLLLAPSIGPTVLSPMLPFAPRMSTGYNLPISHVPGPAGEMYSNGAHVEGIYPISAVYDGQGLNITTCSYADRIGFGYVAGRAVLPDIDALVPLTEQSLAELEAAVGAPSRSSTRRARRTT